MFGRVFIDGRDRKKRKALGTGRRLLSGMVAFRHLPGRSATERTGDNRGDAASEVRIAIGVMWVGAANDHANAVPDRSRSAVVRSAVPGMGTTMLRSAMDAELFPMRVQFPARELAGANVLHEANTPLRTRLNRREYRRTLPVVDGDPERLTLVDGSNSLAFDEDVVGVSRLVVDGQDSANTRLGGAGRSTDQDNSSQNRRNCFVDSHRFVPSEYMGLDSSSADVATVHNLYQVHGEPRQLATGKTGRKRGRESIVFGTEIA